MSDDILTQAGISLELPKAKAIIREIETRCKKCGHKMGDFCPWGAFNSMSGRKQRQYLKKMAKCKHDWKDILIREYDASSPLAGLPRI